MTAVAAAAVMAACGHASTATEGAPTEDAWPGVDAPPVDVFDPTGHVPTIHRAAHSACSHERTPGNAKDAYADAAHSECATDADCTGGINGRCTTEYRGGYNECTYDECFVDEDCGAGRVCDCRTEPATATAFEGGHTCHPAACAVDADCGPGGFCSPSAPLAGEEGNCRSEFGAGWYCHTAHDQCIDDSDCPPSVGPECLHDPASGTWACFKRNGCVAG